MGNTCILFLVLLLSHQQVLDTLIESAYLGEVTSCFLGPVDIEERLQEERTGLLCTKILIWDTKKEVVYEIPADT